MSVGNKFASSRRAIAICDVCGFQWPLRKLRKLVVAGVVTETLACPDDWTPDQPQLMLGKYPVTDAMAIRDPRPDVSYYTSGTNINNNPGEGLRVIQWGWAPVGGGRGRGEITPNDLLSTCEIGDVEVTS